MDPVERIKYLKKIINKNSYLYYIKQNPVITDSEYDIYFRELINLESSYPYLKEIDSPTNRIGAVPSDEFNTVKHINPMLSLSDCFSEEEFYKWYDRNAKIINEKNFEMISELKIDGLAISLLYENSVLKTASTRGDGTIGEDVSSNARTINSIPLVLNHDIQGTIEVRGEVFISISEFQKLNHEREKNNTQKYSNPRNCAAGSLRQLDPSITKSRNLDTFIYNIGYSDNNSIIPRTQSGRLAFLSKLGFKTNEHHHVTNSPKKTIEIYNDYKVKIKELNYLCDGIVVKINNMDYQDEIGELSRTPRWAIAFKYPGNKALTQIEKIEINIGRTGTINPIATLKPIEIDGVIIRNATLHNENYINKLDLMIGDWVNIERAGDVIPKVISVDKNKRDGSEYKFKFPINCPSCLDPIKKDSSDAMYYCVNTTCSSKTIRSLEYFASKNAMDIEGLGPSIIEKLVSKSFVVNFADIYKLTQEDLLQVDGFKEKSANNLIASIHKSKSKPASKLLVSLGIKHIGVEISELLLKKYKSITNLADISYRELLEIPQIGPQIASSIVEYFTKISNINLLKELILLKLKNNYEELNTLFSDNITNKNFVITGKLNKFSRSEIKSTILKYGGYSSENVTNNTDFLIIGESPGSKIEKAKKLKVNIINEIQFLNFLK
jgi:DNA ligase (NAD+)